MAYLTFQTIFFDRFIACFRIRGNVGFFIVTTDFLGYTGTVLVLTWKEFFTPHIDWAFFYNQLAGYVGVFCCIAPLNAFLQVFAEEKGIDITYRQAREPMGLLKIDHIRAILNMPAVNEKFRARYRRDWTKEDVNEMYRSFEKHLFASLKDFTDPIPGVIDTLRTLRADGLKIGSTTGYTKEMMDIVRPGAAAKGYVVDNLVTPDDVPPAPLPI